MMHPTIERAHELIQQVGDSEWQHRDRLARRANEPDALTEWQAQQPPTVRTASTAPSIVKRDLVQERLEQFAEMIGAEVGKAGHDLYTKMLAHIVKLEQRVADLEDMATRP